ncbi:MAG: rod shape-determining protein MreB [Candidatus Berkelbacteria bacterium Licking1014_7]|uniref:Cell shape-determining protein MreB n=1 Tax=Candidatus Berkelbacteria bacterium Licking1014_7 TaxID=2017147 RepID=A0A554LJ94_9BACT|nr:MAG: rod shape-determining protein MreB [Candidatus Berkelbacteria bacterium Licking1014_7]
MFFLKKLAIDLGTKNILVYLPKQGIVINEPSVVVLETSNNKILAVGHEAREMLGRTPESLIALHPLKDGVIANFRITQKMIHYYINKVSGKIRLTRPDVMVSVPAGITSTERRAVIDATVGAGAKNCFIIKEPIAAALGAGISIASSSGNMVIDIGGGTSEVAVIALGDIIASSSVRVGGVAIDNAIIDYIRKKYNLTIGQQTAEEVKIKIGAAEDLVKNLRHEVSGSNTISGLPESIIIETSDVVLAIKDPLRDIIFAVKQVLQKTPPELARDVMDKGIIMTGGASKLRNLDKLFTKVTGVPCQLAEESELCVARGAGIAVEHLDEFKKSVLWAK